MWVLGSYAMAKRTRYARSRGYRGRNQGMERALKHIEEGREFSREIGGTDEDVKAYFFQLNPSELSQILSEYGRLYGKPVLQLVFGQK